MGRTAECGWLDKGYKGSKGLRRRNANTEELEESERQTDTAQEKKSGRETTIEKKMKSVRSVRWCSARGGEASIRGKPPTRQSLLSATIPAVTASVTRGVLADLRGFG